MATSFALGARSFSFVPRSIRFLGLIILTLRHESTLVVRHRILGFLYEADLWYVVLHEETLVYRRGASRGISTIAPGSCNMMPIGSKRFAPQDHG
jgi:hypothetical protein